MGQNFAESWLLSIIIAPMISAFSCRTSRRNRATYASVFVAFVSLRATPDVWPDSCLTWALQAGVASIARMIAAADRAFFKRFTLYSLKVNITCGFPGLAEAELRQLPNEVHRAVGQRIHCAHDLYVSLRFQVLQDRAPAANLFNA